MSVDGWGREGSPRFLCVDTSSENYTPTVLLGQPWRRPYVAGLNPTIAIGAGDFSIEVWAVRRVGNSPGADEQFWTGLLTNIPFPDFPALAAGFKWDGNSDSVQAGIKLVPSFSPVLTPLVTPTRRGAWNHYAANFDRNGDLTFYIDIELKATTPIGTQAGAMAAMEVHGLTSDHAFPYNADPPSFFFDWTTFPIFPVMVGPFAIHDRALTIAEMEESYRGRTVNNFGPGTTLVNYDWRDIEGETGWDTSLLRMLDGHRAGLQVSGGSPQGPPGTVKVLDKSGNDRHWILPTVEDYETYVNVPGDFENGHYLVAFGGEGFFR